MVNIYIHGSDLHNFFFIISLKGQPFLFKMFFMKSIPGADDGLLTMGYRARATGPRARATVDQMLKVVLGVCYFLGQLRVDDIMRIFTMTGSGMLKVFSLWPRLQRIEREREKYPALANE